MKKMIFRESIAEFGVDRHNNSKHRRFSASVFVLSLSFIVIGAFCYIIYITDSKWDNYCFLTFSEEVHFPQLENKDIGNKEISRKVFSKPWIEGFRIEGQKRYIDSLWQSNTLVKNDLYFRKTTMLEKTFMEKNDILSTKTQQLFLEKKIKNYSLSQLLAKSAINFLKTIDKERARELVLSLVSKTESIARGRIAVGYLEKFNDQWAKDQLIKIVLDTNENNYVRRKALVLVGVEQLETDDLLENLIRDNDLVLRRLSTRQLFRIAGNDKRLKIKILGALRWNDICWIKASTSEAPVVDINELIESIARMHSLEPALVHAVIKAESNYNPKCTSSVGAQGLMQLMPATAKSLGVEDPFDVRENILGGVKYLKKMIDRFDSNITLALAAYNAGPTTVSRYKGVPPYKETINYIRKVKLYIREYRKKEVAGLHQKINAI